jgi:hypothetical protein
VLNTLLQVLVFIVGSVALSLFGVVTVRRRVPLATQMEQNEVAGFFIAVLGAVYGVLLAFAVVVVWQNYEDARTNAEQEANSIGDLYRLADAVDEPARSSIQQQIKSYVLAVIVQEWPQLERGQESSDAQRELNELWLAIHTYQPNTIREGAIYQKMLDELQEMSDQRRMRVLASREGIPDLIWALLIGGGIVTVLFTYFFGLKSVRAQLAMTALYVAAIGFVLFLIAAVDFPFDGAVKVQPRAMQIVLERIELVESGQP